MRADDSHPDPPCDASYRKTCRRWNEAGHAHALTFSCFHRQPFLARERACHWLVAALRGAVVAHQFDLWAYVFMPEHVHLVIWPRRPNYDISRILPAVKLPVTRAALSYLRRHAPQYLARLQDRQPGGKLAHRFWQRGGGYDRNLFTDEEVWEKINYVHENPVRRGLVQRPEDWLWSSARYYEGNADGVLTPDFDSLPARIAGAARQKLR